MKGAKAKFGDIKIPKELDVIKANGKNKYKNINFL